MICNNMNVLLICLYLKCIFTHYILHKGFYMNKQVYFLACALLTHNTVFCMEDAREAGRQKWLILQGLNKLYTALLKTRAYPEVQEYQQDVDVKRQMLKNRFPQDIQLLKDGRISYQNTTVDGQVETILM